MIAVLGHLSGHGSTPSTTTAGGQLGDRCVVNLVGLVLKLLPKGCYWGACVGAPVRLRSAVPLSSLLLGAFSFLRVF